MENLKYIPGGLFLLLGICLLGLNALKQIMNYRNRHDEDYSWSSPTPLIAPLLCILGYKLLPLPFNNKIFWVFCLDADTLLLIASIPTIFWQILKKENS